MKGSAAAAEDDLELLKAVAQAWHAQSGNPRPPSRAASGQGAADDGAARRAGVGSTCHRPSRFKLEAAAAARDPRGAGRAPWDFAQSLWDTYELVTVARKLESSLVLADDTGAAPGAAAAAQENATSTQEGRAGRGVGGKRARESSRSLRSMFLRPSSRRFQESNS